MVTPKVNIISKKITKINIQLKASLSPEMIRVADVLYNDGYLYFSYSYEFEEINKKNTLVQLLQEVN